MGTSEIITFCYLRNQSIELLCWRLGHGAGGFQLSLANRVHDFNPCNRTAGRPKRFESHHRPHLAFHRPVILLNGLITNDKFCFARTSQVKLRWAHRPRRDSPQALMAKREYLPKTLHLAGGTSEAQVANPASLSDSHRRSAALGPSLPTPTGVGAGVQRKRRSAPRHALLPRTGGR